MLHLLPQSQSVDNHVTEMMQDTTQSSHILEVQDVVNNLDHQLLDLNLLYTHTSLNTLEQYYQQIISDVVFNLTVIPVNQEILGLEPIDDEASVNVGLGEIAVMLARVFNKTPTAVKADVYSKMDTFPIDDTRESRRLHHANRLH